MSEQGDGRDMNVLFIPYDDGNPYQGSLRRELAAAGVKVSPRNWLKGLVKDIIRGRENPDVVHLHWLPANPNTLTGWLRSIAYVARVKLLRLMGKSIVWTVHNLYSHEVASRKLERWLTRCVIRNASRVIVHSETARALVIEEFGVGDPARIVVVPHGNYIGAYGNSVSQEGARKRLELPPGGAGFLFFGNIRPYKGVEDLIGAYRQSPASSGFLLVAGRPLNGEVSREIENLCGDDSRIHFRPGMVPDEEIQCFMNACDVVVFPYRQVLTSGAVILAMSFGKACIAPHLGCIPDVLDEQGGFLYDPDDPEGLGRALEQAARESDRLAEMGAHNLGRAREWGWDRISRSTADIYAEAVC